MAERGQEVAEVVAERGAEVGECAEERGATRRPLRRDAAKRLARAADDAGEVVGRRSVLPPGPGPLEAPDVAIAVRRRGRRGARAGR